jgi:exosome complex RNA-binding protein Rrp42 (RNase PH superfamily)
MYTDLRCASAMMATILEQSIILPAITALAHFRSVSILNRHGNIIDCSSIAAITALAHFRSVSILNRHGNIIDSIILP